MKPTQLTLLQALLRGPATACFLFGAAAAMAQSQFPALGQTELRPPASASGPARLGVPATALGAPAPTPAPGLVGQASKTPSLSDNALSVRVLTKTESASQDSKLLVAKTQLMAQAKQTGASPDKADAAISNLQAGDSAKLSLLTPRHAWANLNVERPDKIDFDTGTLQFDATVIKVNSFAGHPACNFTAPAEGYYMVDVVVEMENKQSIVTWTTSRGVDDGRAKSVTQQVQGGVNHILVSIQAGKPPKYSMTHTVQFFGGGRYTFNSCEITRLK